jgi:uncharacterized protein YjbI with pentapeptide repeats
MANPEHLELLRQGVEVWNAWRAKEPSIHPDLGSADLSRAFLFGASLIRAILSGAILGEANLSGANLSGAQLIETNLADAILTGCSVYGVSAWGVKLGAGTIQQGLITVDDLEVAQFVYLLLHNEKIRRVIDTITSKVVLILGRFSIPQRKAVLDALRDDTKTGAWLRASGLRLREAWQSHDGRDNHTTGADGAVRDRRYFRR